MEEYQYHIFAPYRVCPIGAHVDHQHGLVTGFAIDKGVDLWFNVRDDEMVNLSSRTFEGDVSFEITKPSQIKERHWGDYARGLAACRWLVVECSRADCLCHGLR